MVMSTIVDNRSIFVSKVRRENIRSINVTYKNKSITISSRFVKQSFPSGLAYNCRIFISEKIGNCVGRQHSLV